MSKIQQYLEPFRSKENVSHTAYGVFNGTYTIPQYKLSEMF